MRISLFNSETDTSPRQVDLSWEELVERLREPRVTACQPCPSITPTPDGTPSTVKCDARKGAAWSPALFDGNGRKAENVVGMDCLVFDLDHLSEGEAEILDASLEGWAAILHSTHSHAPDREPYEWAAGKKEKAWGHCYRLVLKLTRPLEKWEIKPTRAAAVAALGLPADPATKDPGRLYFMPTHPAGQTYTFGTQDGRSFEPTSIAPPAPPSFEAPVASLSPAVLPPVSAVAEVLSPAIEAGPLDLKELAKKALARTHRSEHFGLVKRALKGQKLAEVGSREGAMFDLASAIGFELYDTPVDALLELVRESVNAMEPGHRPHMEVMREKFLHHQARGEEYYAERMRAQRGMRFMKGLDGKKSAKAPTNDSAEEEGEPSEQPHPPEVLAKWYADQSALSGENYTDDNSFRLRWIMRKDGAHWIFTNGRYQTPVSERDLAYSLERDLSLCPVALVDQEGDRLPISEVLHVNGTVPRQVVASLSLPASYYDPKSQTFYEAVCPIRPELAPVFDDEVDMWLRLLGGDDYDKLVDWLSVVPRLDRQAALLYLRGEQGVGKNVLASGLARLWGRGAPTRFDTVVGSDFNDALTRCPLIHADEGLPQSDDIVDLIRNLVGSSTRSLKRKFLPTADVHGNIRLLITANNRNVFLRTGATLGPDDIDAFTARILYIEAPSGAASPFLHDFRLRYEERAKAEGLPMDDHPWVLQDTLAKHVLWLRDNHTQQSTARFYGANSTPQFVEQMVTGVGAAGAVLEFLARYLSDPNSKGVHPKLRAGGGELLVNAGLLSDKIAWEKHVPSRNVPSAKVVSDALLQVSEENTVMLDRQTFFKIRIGLFLGWCQRNQVGEPTIIEERINAPRTK